MVTQPCFTSGHSLGTCLGCFKSRDATLLINSHLCSSQDIVRKSAAGLVLRNIALFCSNGDSAMFHLWHSLGTCLCCFKSQDATLVINSHLGPSQDIVRKSAGGLVWWNRSLFCSNGDLAMFHLWSLPGDLFGLF